MLPTGGTARFFSVVSVEDFQRRMSRIEIGNPVFERLALAGSRLARLEGLEGRRALEIRLAPARRRVDPSNRSGSLSHPLPIAPFRVVHGPPPR